MLDIFSRFLGFNLGIDLGTKNTRVFAQGKGIVFDEPTLIARQAKKLKFQNKLSFSESLEAGKILAYGKKAKEMIGKEPQLIELVAPLTNGVISDFDAASVFLGHYFKLIAETPGIKFPQFFKPMAVMAVSSKSTEVERRAVQEVALSSGARKVFLIESVMAAAIGAELPIEDPAGFLICVCGGGTTEISVISLGGIVLSRVLENAGEEMDEAIITYIRLKYGVLVGLPTAEKIKQQVGNVSPSFQGKGKQMVVRGRDMETGLPKSLRINEAEIREAILPVVQKITIAVNEILEETPPELTVDILKRGILLAGGIARLNGLDKLISEELKISVWRADNPDLLVVKGCGTLLENEKLLNRVKLTGGLK